MRNKRGEGYILTCIIVLVVCMLLSVFITFATTVNMVRMTKRNSQIVLDSFVMENSILIYNSIKNGNDYTNELQTDVYIDNLCSFCTFEENADYLYAYSSDGVLKYKLSRPEIFFSTEGELKIYTQYTVYIPVGFGGATVTMAQVPITVESKFNEKF